MAAENIVFITDSTADPVPSVPMIFSPSAAPSALTPMDLVDRALASGAGIEVIGKMMDYQERWQKSQARMAFDNAMAAAKAEIPIINKNRTVDFTSQKGRTHYRYEDLAEIAREVTPILARYGLSYRFRTSAPVNEPVTVTCIISHRDGHFEENSLPGPRDDSGNKNAIQAIGSTLTYLQRMTLKAALGLVASDDDDGCGAGASEKISAEDAENLTLKLQATKSNIPAFLKLFNIADIADMRAADLDRATAMLERKAKDGK